MSFPELIKPYPPSFDRVLKDYSDPMSLINLVSPEVAKRICALPQDLIDITEEEMELKNPDPDPSTLQLRNLFWREYDRAMELRSLMDMTRTYIGVMTKNAFYKLIEDPKKLAWVVNPPKEYLNTIEQMHTAVLRQIHEMIKLPVVSSTGFIDSKFADVKLKIFMALDMRLKGGYIQRSMQINQNINENRNTNVYETPEHERLDIDARIKMLEDEISKKEQRRIEPEVQNPMLTKQQHTVERVAIETDFKEVNESGSET